jgi:GNAT superfamily N-acetyltransferase
MKNQLTYQQASRDDEPLVADFYSRGFPELAAFKYPLRFEWMYKKSPFHTDPSLLPIWLAINGEKALGLSALMPQEFSVNGETITGAWCCDFRVLPECRGMGVGTKLEQLRKENSNLFSVTSSPTSIHIKRKLGYSVRYAYTLFLHVNKFEASSIYKDFVRYLHVNQSWAFSNSHYRIHLESTLEFFLRLLFKLRQRSQSPELKHSLSFSRIDVFPDTVNDLWDRIKFTYSFSTQRYSSYLNWKFVEQPYMDFHKYLVHRDGNLCGVLVLRKDGPIGIISELYTSEEPTVMDAMLDFAMRSLYEQGSFMIQCIGSSKTYRRLLRRFGFITMEDFYGAFCLLPENKRFDASIRDNDWLISFGDHDLDEYGRTGHPSLLSLLRMLSPWKHEINTRNF